MTLDIEDNFEYGNPTLVRICNEKLDELFLQVLVDNNESVD